VPELPDVTLYCERLAARVAGAALVRAVVVSPNLLRTAEPPLEATYGRRVVSVRRMGKRIVVALEGGLFLVLHLMIAGRLRWRPTGAKVPGKAGLAAFEFSTGTLLLTEASTKHRASLHVVSGEDGVRALDPGGLEPLEADPAEFRTALARGNHTLKRALTVNFRLKGASGFRLIGSHQRRVRRGGDPSFGSSFDSVFRADARMTPEAALQDALRSTIGPRPDSWVGGAAASEGVSRPCAATAPGPEPGSWRR
jgi:hypothetical protein